MKKLLILILIFSSNISWGQTNNRRATLSLLQWLIKRDHIQYLNAKSNVSIFYDTTALTKRTLMADSNKSAPHTSISDFLSPHEIYICKTAPPMLMQTDWRIKYLKLKTIFVTDKFYVAGKYTIYTFSEPIFLNEAQTRVIIGEDFFCGPACGRDDMLLCELKNGKWHLLARAIIDSD